MCGLKNNVIKIHWDLYLLVLKLIHRSNKFEWLHRTSLHGCVYTIQTNL